MATDIIGNLDFAALVLWVFWGFFAGLIYYLRREDRREGYPLESESAGIPENIGPFWLPDPKVFRLADGTIAKAPNGKREPVKIKAKPAAPWPGAPLLPTGNPMTDGIGPASYAQRADEPDRTLEGTPKIVPLSNAKGYGIDREDPDPRGMSVIGADGKIAGKVTDVWVDQSEALIRYFEVGLGSGDAASSGGARVLLPVTFTRIAGFKPAVRVDSILAHQFADVPRHKNPQQVTFLEEDMITAYYASGKLYATPSRQEPLI